MASSIDDRKCTKCTACVQACPTKSIFEGARAFVVDADTCIDCLDCARVCPTAAIQNPLYKPPARPRRKGRAPAP
jgi:NAD-dependent dihydropyrimidine dehydrogenase PreA subunit